MVLVRELVDGQQLDGGDAEPDEVLERGGVREPGVRAAQPLRNTGVTHREAAHMQFVEDGIRPRRLGPAVVLPFVGAALVPGVLADHDALGDVRCRVPVVAHGVGDLLLRPVADVPVELGGQRAPRPGRLRTGAEVAVHGPGIRVQQQLRRVPAGAAPGVPAAVHPVAVALAGADAGQEAVPDLVGELGQRMARLALRVVEETQFHGLGAARPQGEVGAGHAIGAGAVSGP